MILRLALILMFIASVAAGGLALLNSQTAPVIAENKRIEQEQARKEVLASQGAVRFEEIRDEDGFTWYKAYDAEDNLVGYAAVAKGKGYSSTIETVTGLTADLRVAGLKVTFQQETPGLGTKIEEESWLSKFKDRDAATVAVVQDRGDIDAITGATISSRAVSKSINDVAAMIKERAEASPAQVTEDATAIEAGGDEFDLDEDATWDDGAYTDEEAGLEDDYDDEEAE